MKNKIIIITALLLISLSSFAQSDKTKNISGLIQDEGQKPVEAASISLLKTADSSTIKTITSDKKGSFSFHNIANGKYLISISSVGHASFYSPAFQISSDNPLVQLGTIALKPETKELKAVSVVGVKPFIEQKADRMIVNVDASPSNAGATVMDVLEKSPGVTVDKDDNISLKGKQNVTIMIDNKPTYMSATQLASYLKSLPASAIDQLEIMTNPSAKYDAAGNSGIINIKTKKNKTKGFNGSLTLTHTQGVYPKPSGSINLNYKTGKANFFFNGGFSHWEGYQNLDINRNYLDPTSKNITSIFTQHTAMKFVNPEFNAKIGMDYYVNNKTTVGFVFSGFHSEENNTSNSTIFLKNADNL
ncbi:MAG TPA: carboxypeptidase regulatory-like domain-containing protein, partial [Puia sp.]|nr:carboxypeptidase regulatory-like domain-containing protein [Puia sp.]